MAEQTAEEIAQAIDKLITQTATNIPMPTMPSLDLALPTGADLDTKWREFLERAQKDPDIINYYQNLLQQAQGDTKLAIGFLEKDYTVGTRQVKDNLTATLEKLGLVSRTEQQDLASNLNQRGIAMTDIGGGQVAYAGGGQPATEVGRLNDVQRLRKEAEERTARQGIETLGMTREKGITEAGQGLTKTAQGLAKAKQQDILGRGTQYFNMFTEQEKAKAQQKIQEQASGSSQSSGGRASIDKSAINPETGRAYAVRPDGVWDDNWFVQNYG